MLHIWPHMGSNTTMDNTFCDPHLVPVYCMKSSETQYLFSLNIRDFKIFVFSTDVLRELGIEKI